MPVIELVIDGINEPAARVLTDEDVAALRGDLAAFKADLQAEVNRRRDLLIDGGFDFEGHVIQSRATDRENIAALALDAEKAIDRGASAGDYGWHPSYPAPFGFIMADNQVAPIDAFQMVAMRQAGAAFKARLTFYARALKDQIETAADHDAATAVVTLASWPT
jgi:hypothetical protein